MKKKTPVILCVDTGIDDAIGISIASMLNFVDIKLIVCDEGNSSIENITKNTMGVLDTIKAKNIPIVKGYKDKNYRFVFSAHGNNGLSGYTFPKSEREILNDDASSVIYKTLKENQGTFVFILGPQTSIAHTLKTYPDAKNLISKLVIMCGSLNEKLDTKKPYTEFNVSSNPEAAEIVLSSGIETLIVPSEIGTTCTLDYFDIYKTKNTNYTGSFFEILFRNYHHRKVSRGVATCDLVTILAPFYSEIYEIKPVYAFVKYFDNVKTGVCLFDFDHKPNMKICTNINKDKFKKLYFKLLKKLP